MPDELGAAHPHAHPTYITDADAWGSLPWDLRSIALYRTGRYAEALAAAEAALRLAPDDPRLQSNVRLIRKTCPDLAPGGTPDGANSA